MTAEFNITTPGAEIIKRLSDLENSLGSLQYAFSTIEYFVTKEHEERLDKLRTDVAALKQRVEQLEDAAGWKEGANMENNPAPVDTSWHPYDVLVDGDLGCPHGYKRVVVMTRDGNITGPQKADLYTWNECEDATIIAWRYAKAGE